MSFTDGNLAYQIEPETEIIGGKVVMMASPTTNHITIGFNLSRLFGNYLEDKPCRAYPDGMPLFLEEGKEEYKPDMMVVCDPDKITRNGIYGAPDLVVEILSPSTARRDRGPKMRTYERNGVREYWIVDPANRAIEQYILESGRFVLRDVYTQYTKETFSDLTDEEKAAVVTEFHCSLFDDLTIRLKDVFAHLID
ncbi:MAG: Uma2 family endonuclease [Oscillibacter sp.]|nr:Uma2 family endonuclease [Oscillibacter sp.]MBQ7681519.1 Uma2 family endonuclease [Oscillibacter sp.]MBQ9618008.1 Uma2 family endonuclease [Oscillibacter sp.]